MNHGQTACLVACSQFAAEESVGFQFVLRPLTREAKRTDKNTEKQKDSTAKVLRMI